MTVKIKRSHENAQIPTRGTEKAGGWDIYATEIITDPEQPDFVRVMTGIHLQPEPGTMIRIAPRSSLTKTHWIIQNSPVLCDEDYTGEYEIRFRAFPIGAHYTGIENSNITLPIQLVYPEFPFKPGDRIAQLYKSSVLPIVWEVVTELEETARGAGGFGSTGA